MKRSGIPLWMNEIQELFRRARRDLYYPPIDKLEPAATRTIKVDLTARRHKIFIGKGVVEQYSPAALLGILHHELNHWARHPYDLKTVILEQAWLGEAPQKNLIRNLYDDTVVNLDLVVNKGLEQVAQAYREMPLGSGLDRLMRSFYADVTGIDFGHVAIDAELEEKLRELQAINFLDLGRIHIKHNIRRFAEILQDLIEDEVVLPFTLFSLEDFRTEEIFKAMEGIADEVTPREYQAIADEVLQELQKPGLKPVKRKTGGKGISPGKRQLLQELERPEVAWYRSRARRYAIAIESLVKQGSLYPAEITDFDLDDGIDNFDPVESYGKILPSLAKRHKLAEFERYGEISVPDAVIMMDSSGSMANPENVVSYAVLGAFAVARNYFNFGAKVGVINFSNSNLLLEPTVDRQAVYEMLKTYQGYGTTLHIDDLDRYVANLPAGVGVKDYILITDAGIENVDKVIEYFGTIEGRLTVIWIKGEGDFDEKFKENYERLIKQLPPSVTFAEVGREQDIPRIAVGKMFGAIYESN